MAPLITFIGLVIVLIFFFMWWLPRWRLADAEAKREELEILDKEVEIATKAKKKYGNTKKKRNTVSKYKKS